MEQLLRELLNAPIREQFVVLSVVAIVLALGFGFVGATIGAYFGGRIGARRAIGLIRREPMTVPSPELDQIRNALDAIAVEVERVAEGQRFTARLLNDRVNQASALPLRRDAGSVTPH
jgi:hypothetical protein